MKIVDFKNDGYNSLGPSNYVILVKSESDSKVYKVRCGPYECSCPAYAKFSAPWLNGKTDRHGRPLGDDYICKHMRKLLELPLDEENMLSLLKSTDGDIELFCRNYSWTKLLILYFRQLIVFSKGKVIVLE